MMRLPRCLNRRLKAKKKCPALSIKFADLIVPILPYFSNIVLFCQYCLRSFLNGVLIAQIACKRIQVERNTHVAALPYSFNTATASPYSSGAANCRKRHSSSHVSVIVRDTQYRHQLTAGCATVITAAASAKLQLK
jgi:hypothetical protein